MTASHKTSSELHTQTYIPSEAVPNDAWTGDDLVGIAGFFTESRILQASVDWDLYELTRTSQSTDELAELLQIPAPRLRPILSMLASLQLLDTKDDYWINGVLARHHLIDGAPDDLRAYIKHLARMWSPWQRLDQLFNSEVCREEFQELRGGFGDQIQGSAHQSFTLAMSEESGPGPAQLAALNLWGAARRVLDLGGGHGRYLIEFARRFPELTGEVVDSPPALEVADTLIQDAGLSHRLTTRISDLSQPEGWADLQADTILLVNVLSNLGREESTQWLRRCAKLLSSGGRLVIVGPHHHSMNAEAGLFALHMAIGCWNGWAVEEEFLCATLTECGFIVKKYPLNDEAMAWVGTR